MKYRKWTESGPNTLRLQIGTEMSCFVRTINQRSHNGRSHIGFSPQTCLIWPTQCFKNWRYPILNNLDFHLLKTQKIWQLSSLPTGSHQLELSRSCFLRDSLISSTHYISHQSSTVILHTPRASLSQFNERAEYMQLPALLLEISWQILGLQITNFCVHACTHTC